MIVHAIDRKDSDGGQKFCFHCPACGFSHWFKIGGQPSWTWNEDFNKPTIKPSIKAYGGVKGGEGYFVCHSFVTDGRIKYLNDCTHDKAGQTLDLIDID